jgi:hypothetical protein
LTYNLKKGNVAHQAAESCSRQLHCRKRAFRPDLVLAYRLRQQLTVGKIIEPRKAQARIQAPEEAQALQG